MSPELFFYILRTILTFQTYFPYLKKANVSYDIILLFVCVSA
jgi:hypothetical protein